MSKYKFVNVDHDGTKNITTYEGYTSTEVLRAFCYFLKGVSFSDSSILSALEEVLAELEPLEEKPHDISNLNND